MPDTIRKSVLPMVVEAKVMLRPNEDVAIWTVFTLPHTVFHNLPNISVRVFFKTKILWLNNLGFRENKWQIWGKISQIFYFEYRNCKIKFVVKWTLVQQRRSWGAFSLEGSREEVTNSNKLTACNSSFGFRCTYYRDKSFCYIGPLIVDYWNCFTTSSSCVEAGITYSLSGNGWILVIQHMHANAYSEPDARKREVQKTTTSLCPHRVTVKQRDTWTRNDIAEQLFVLW